jgi:folate-binding protein YgfZ
MMNSCHIQQPVCLIEATGPDAFDFLQSQFSNDLRNSSAADPVYGLWLNTKGRIQGDSFVFRRDTESFFIVSRHTDGVFLKNFLEERIIADEVELSLVTSAWFLVSKLNLSPTEETLHTWFSDPTLPDNYVSCLVQDSGLDDLLSRESLSVVPADVMEMELLLNRILRIPIDLPISVFPQEIGLESFVSYQKGCFLGQEVMARLRYQGQVRRSLQLYTAESHALLPAIGSALNWNQKKVGTVMRVATSLDHQYILGLGSSSHEDTVMDENNQQWSILKDN